MIMFFVGLVAGGAAMLIYLGLATSSIITFKGK